MTAKHRKEWEKHHNACILPGIEIHHIDGDHNNNNIDNLIAVTPEEHYRIHLNQQDYGAASLISNRANLPLEEVIAVRIKAGQIGGAYSRDNNLGFFNMSKEKRTEVSKSVGIYTRDNKLGIHKINADPILSKENSSFAGKKSYEKRAGFHARPYQQESVGGTKWWSNTKTGEKIRSKESPGNDWVNKMCLVKGKPRKSKLVGFYWWNDGNGNRKRSLDCPGENWKKGIK